MLCFFFGLIVSRGFGVKAPFYKFWLFFFLPDCTSQASLLDVQSCFCFFCFFLKYSGFSGCTVTLGISTPLEIFDNVNMFYDVTCLLLNVRFYFTFIAWAERKGYKTAKAARNDVYRAANSLLRLAVDGRLCLCLRPSDYSCLRGKGGIFPDLSS